MPLSAKGETVLRNMEREYGPKKGEQVFYASKNKGTITGVDEIEPIDGGRTESGINIEPIHQHPSTTDTKLRSRGLIRRRK